MTDRTDTRPGVDPAMLAFAEALPTFTIADGVEAARDIIRKLTVPAEMLPAMRIEDRVVGFGEITDVPVRIYWPPGVDEKNLPVVVLYHGGGWAIGDLDTYDAVARTHVIGTDAIVVSVDYRLAPEHPWPAGIDDSWAALRWVGEHAAELGGDPDRVAVAGDSSGGNFAAVMAQLARDHAGPKLVYQLLWYPAATCDLTLPSHIENANTPILGHDQVAAFMTWYLPGMTFTDSTALPPTVAPANADLSGLPPTFIGTAEYDPIRDDGARYAEMLTAAGVVVEHQHEPTLLHGYVSVAGLIPAATEATQTGLSALRRALHPA